jgi:anaerobic selenocysteine-containing dehydrogenase
VVHQPDEGLVRQRRHQGKRLRYDWLPKKDGAYDALAIFERMHQGKMNGFFCQGFNPLASVANKKKVGDALAKLKYLVIIDPLATDTSEFWKNYGEFNEVDPAKIQTEVFRLPANLFAEETGSFTNSGRVIQWHWKAADGPGRIEGRHRDPGGAVPQAEGDVRQGRRQAARADPEPDLALPHPGQARRRRNSSWRSPARRWAMSSIRKTRPR